MQYITPPENLNVAVVLSHYDLSGVTSNTIDLCEGLKNIGHNVTLIVGHPLDSKENEKSVYAKSKGFNIREMPNPHNGIKERLKSFLFLSKELSEGKYDIIHMESIYLSIIPKLLHKKFTVTLHSWGLKKNIFAPRATRIIAISEGMKQEAITRHGYKESDIDIVLHGVSPRFAEPFTNDDQQSIRKQLELPTDKILIGIVASIEPRKGHHFLLEAVSMLPKEMIDRIHMVFCGNYKGEGSQKWISEQISKFDLDSKVSLLGFQDPLDVYRSLDIFVLPSIWEGFPLTAVEAMLANCCVIRSNVQGAKEQIIDGETGFVFESQNPEALYKTLTALLTDTKLIKQVAANGREYALKNFTLDTMARNTANVYRKILSRSSH